MGGGACSKESRGRGRCGRSLRIVSFMVVVEVRTLIPMIFGQNMKMFSSSSGTPFRPAVLVAWPLVRGCCSTATTLRLEDFDLLEGVGDFFRDLVLEEEDVAIVYYVMVVRGGEIRPGILAASAGVRVRFRKPRKVSQLVKGVWFKRIYYR